MTALDAWQAAFLGLIEGLTEFIPVSSTGHLILAVDLLGFRGPPGRVFEVVIQLGAVLAVCWAFRAKIGQILVGLAGRQPGAIRFTVNVVLAFLPAAVLGAAFSGFIKARLFSPLVVSVTLILGGVAILLVERHLRGRKIPAGAIETMRPPTALRIGAFQALALIPGTSRSGATIVGALLLGVDRRTATEFSFFLAIPTMLGATVFDLYKNRGGLDEGGGLLIAIGFVVAFAAGLLVVRSLISFVARFGFAPFAWYRIAVGLAMLALLASR